MKSKQNKTKVAGIQRPYFPGHFGQSEEPPLQMLRYFFMK